MAVSENLLHLKMTRKILTKLELPWLAGQQLVHGLEQCLEHARDGSSTLKTRVKLQSSSGLCHIFSSAMQLGVLLPSFCSAQDLNKEAQRAWDSGPPFLHS